MPNQYVDFTVDNAYTRNTIQLKTDMSIEVKDLVSELDGTQYAEEIGVGLLNGNASGATEVLSTLSDEERRDIFIGLLESFSEEELRGMCIEDWCPVCEERRPVWEEVEQIEKEKASA